MSKFAGLSLAFVCLAPTAAAAQTVSPPVRWEDTPHIGLNMRMPPAAAGTTWRRTPMPRVPATPPMAARPNTPAMAPGHSMPMAGRPMGPRLDTPSHRPMTPHATMTAPRPVVHPPHAGVPRADHPGTRRFNAPPHARDTRMWRGQHLDRNWFSARYRIHNFGFYGFPPPMPGGYWVRHYDDALLVDRDGLVVDTRYGVDWDGDRGRWGRNDDSDYVGDYEDREYGYDADDDYAGRYDYDDEDDGAVEYDTDSYDDGVTYRGVHYGAYPGLYAYPMGPVVITETTVTTPTVVEKVIYRKAPPRPAKTHRVWKPKHRCVDVCSAHPPYRGGEKG